MKFLKYLSILRISFLNSLAYRYDFLFRGIFFVIILFIFRQIWQSVDLSSHHLSIENLVWYLVITESIMLSFPDVRERVDTDIKSGTIALMLTKPFHYPAYLYMLYAGEFIPRFLVNITLGFAAAWYFTGIIPLTAVSTAGLALCIVFSITLNFFIALLLSMLSFWFEETKPFFWIYHKILFTLGGLLIPLQFFPDFLRKISESLPFTVILYRPAMLTLSYSHNAFSALVRDQCIWIAVLAVFCEILYITGIRRVSINGG